MAIEKAAWRRGRGQGAHLDALDAEAQRSAGADPLPPLHVARLGHGALRVFFVRRGGGVHSHHLLIHVLAKLGPLPRLGQLFFQVSPAIKVP